MCYQRIELLLGRFDGLPYEGSEGTTYEGTYDEYPQLVESLTTLEEGRTDRAGRVDRSAGVVDTYQVDEDEGKTDSQTSEVVGGTIGLVGGTEDNHHEDEGQDDLSNQAVDDVG